MKGGVGDAKRYSALEKTEVVTCQELPFPWKLGLSVLRAPTGTFGCSCLPLIYLFLLVVLWVELQALRLLGKGSST